jgi:RimJ/RimL family protein N-acetyltransferase
MTTNGRVLIQAAKALAGPEQPTLSLPVGLPTIGLLRPVVTRRGETSPADVRALTDWRNRHVKSFLTEFVATEERTERWLVEVVGPDDTRILFMVEDGSGRTIGYMGLAFIDWEAGSAEVDAIVRGAKAPPDLMSRSILTMWSWGRSVLGLERLCGRVRSDNPALAFFEKVGIRNGTRVPLRREQAGDEVRWVEDPSLPPGDPSLVYIELKDNGG